MDSGNEPTPFSLVVTPSDVTVFAPPLRKLWVGVAGNLSIQLAGMTTPVTLVGVPIGMLNDLRISKVMATDTTATTMIGFW
jgi:hypothetical protein